MIKIKFKLIKNQFNLLKYFKFKFENLKDKLDNILIDKSNFKDKWKNKLNKMK